MKSYSKKLLSVLVICSMTFVWIGAYAFAGPVSAASKTSLSKKSVSMTKGSKRTIKLKNARKKVVWKSSNKKIVKIVKTKGKRKNTVTFKGIKKGKAYVIAKVGKKKYRCKVVVKAPKKTPQPQPAPEEKDRPIETRRLSDSSIDLSKEFDRNPLGNTAANEQFSSAYTNFSIDLFKRVSAAETAKGNKGSVLVSPDSVETALAMMENGAAGDTLTEMQTVLGGGMETGQFCAYLAGINDRLEKSDKVIFKQANSIWAKKNDQDEMLIRNDFLQTNKDYFNAQFFAAPFDNTTVSDMNNWVYNNTRNMIDSVIDRLDPSVAVVLINTTVLEGKWAVPFETVTKGTQQDKFTDASGTQKNATMLHDKASYEYFKMNGADCFRRDYRGGQIAFVGILPKTNDVDSFVQGMSGESFRNAWKTRSSKNVQLTMPEFFYDYDTDLGNVLSGMGIQKAFTPTADFSNLGTPPVMIDRVIHKTHIELDRNGTKAAAATAVTGKASSIYMGESIEIKMNRPFVYAIVDTTTGVPLFIGTVKTLQ